MHPSISEGLRPAVYSRGMRVRFPEPQCPSGRQRCARPRRRRDPFEQHPDRTCSDHTSWPYLCSSSRSFKGAWRGGVAFRSRSPGMQATTLCAPASAVACQWLSQPEPPPTITNAEGELRRPAQPHQSHQPHQPHQPNQPPTTPTTTPAQPAQPAQQRARRRHTA